MNEQKKILFYEEGFFEKSIREYDPRIGSYSWILFSKNPSS